MFTAERPIMRGMTWVIGVAVAIIAFHAEAQVPNAPGRGDEFGVRTNPLLGGAPPYGDRFDVNSRDTRCGDDYGPLYGLYNTYFGVQGVLVPYTTMNQAADQFSGCGPCPAPGGGMMICWPKTGSGPPPGAIPEPPPGRPPGSPAPPSGP